MPNLREEDITRWESFLKDVLLREGGYINHPDDVGGPTKYGITLGTLEAWHESYGSTEKLQIEDIRDLSIDTAKQIYFDLYIEPFTHITNFSTAKVVVDAAINHGVKNAVKMLQNAVNNVDWKYTLLVDGRLGEITLAAVNRVNQIELKNHFNAQRLRFYARIIQANPKQKVFVAGWMNRMADVLEKST